MKLTQNTEEAEESSEDESEEEEDIDAAMKKEVKAIKEVKVTERRFQNVNTKSRNTIFIKTLIENPCDMAQNILSDILESGIQKSRFAIRMLPIENVCKARLNEMEDCGKELFKKYFETPLGSGLSYTTLFTRRNNTDLARETVIPRLGQLIKDLNPLHKVNHVSPDCVILVEIIGNLCCMSVVKDFFKLKKYNLIEVSKVKDSQNKYVNEAVVSSESQENDKKNGNEIVQSEGQDLGDQVEEQKSEITTSGPLSSDNFSGEPNSSDTRHEIKPTSRKRKAPSLSREETEIVHDLAIPRNKTVVMETFNKSETVVMESLPRSETVVMENLDRKESVMDALCKGESVMEMSVPAESVMDVLHAGESVMDNDDELDLT